MHLPETQNLFRSHKTRILLTVGSTCALLLSLVPSAFAQSGRGSHDHATRAHRSHVSGGHGYNSHGFGGHGFGGHGFGTHRYGYQGSDTHRTQYGSIWGHGYGSLFGGHGFLVTRQSRGHLGGFGYFAGQNNRGNHGNQLRSIGHPSRWLYDAPYLSSYYASPYYTYKSTSPTAPTSPITGYDGTIGSYLGYEPLPVKKVDNAPESAEIDARQQPASVLVAIEPGDASVYLDGNFLGVASDLPQTLLVAPGAHRLEAARPGYESLELELDVTAGETFEIRQSLKTAGSN